MTEPQTFRKRRGTTSKGIEYEYYNIAHIVLNLVSDENVKNFHISANDDVYDAFDDIVVDVELNDRKETYAIQLKHSDRGKLSKERLKEPKGDFSINKYFSSFERIKKNDDVNYILFTNLTLAGDEDIDIQIEGENFIIRPIEVKNSNGDYINTSNSSEGFCYRFQLINPTEVDNQFQCFLKKFRLYVSQQSLNSLKISTEKKFKEIFSSDGFDQFFKVISEWSKEEGKKGEKEKLSMEWMQNAIAIHALSSKIKPLSFGEVNENMKILREAIGMFDVTLLEKETSYDTVKELWGDMKSGFKATEEINKLRTKYQLDSIYIEDFEKVNTKLSSKLLWLMGKCPLIVTKDETVEKIMQICKRSSFIVIDENLNKDWVKLPSFQKLPDLKEKNSTKLDEIVSKFTLSLQGKNCTLKKLLEDEKFLDLITTDDLLQVSKGTLSYGGDKEILCEPYVDRFLSRNVIDIKFLENVDAATLIIIDCVENESDFKRKFRKLNFVMVDDYLTANTNRYGATICISRNKCDVPKFQQTYAKNKEKKICHQFRLGNNDTLEWIQSKGDVEALKKYIINDNNCFVPEKDLFSCEPERKVNLVIGDPGLGKSELMKSLKNNCLDTFWTVIMYSKDIIALYTNLKKETNKGKNVEQLIFDIKCNSLSPKEQNVFDLLAEQKKIIYVWEALDEVSSEHVEEVTKIIKQFSDKGYIQWITSRYILKNYLEKTFDVLAININKFNDQEQQSYIYDRLKHHCNSDKIEKVVDKLKSTFVLIEHFDILGIPLQLYMLTELFLQDVDGYLKKFTNTFVLTDLYYYFVEEKFNVYFRDKLKIDMQIPGNKLLFKSHKLEALKYFEIMSVRTLFSEDILKQLNIENYIENSEDYSSIGIVTEINNDIPRFIHKSFPEYFAAFYLFRNVHSNTTMTVMKEFIFDEKYNNVRFFFDLILAKNSKEECLAHVAFLYKNYQLLESYDEEILTRKDVGGRTVLHLASSWGQRSPTLPVEKRKETFIINGIYAPNVKAENLEFQKAFQYLLEMCKSKEIDSLFNSDCLLYAKKTSCVFAQIKLMYDQKLKLSESVDHAILLYYSALLGYHDAFEMLDSENLDHIDRKGNDNITAKGARISLTDNFNRTLLYIASENGHDKIVEFLVEKGAEITLAAKNGFTPLHIASLNGQDKIVEFLVEKGAEINLAGKNGFTPLYIASQNGHDKIVEFLVEKGAEINLADKDGFTPVHIASLNGQDKIVEFLVEKGAEINLADKYGFTPLHRASLSGHDKIVEFLVEKGAEINFVNKDGSTPLHVAFEKGREKIVEFLVAKGAKFTVDNKTSPV